MAEPSELRRSQLSTSTAALVHRVWRSSLVTGVTLEEKLRRQPLRASRATGRQLLGLDIYQCKALAKTLGVTTPAQLYGLYTKQSDDSSIRVHRFCSLLSSACVARATAENVAAVLEQVYRETGLSGVSASRFPSQTSHDGSTVRKPTHAEQPGLTEDEGAAESSPPDSLPTLTHGSVAARSITSCSAQQPQGSSSVLPPVVPVRDTPSSHAVRAAGIQHSASAPEVSRDDAARLVGGAQRRGVDLYDYFVDGADVVMPDDSADSQPVDSPAIQNCHRAVGLIRNATPVALGYDWRSSVQRAWSPDRSLRASRDSEAPHTSAPRRDLHTDGGSGHGAPVDDDFEQFEAAVLLRGPAAADDLARSPTHDWQVWASPQRRPTSARSPRARGADRAEHGLAMRVPADVDAYVSTCVSGMELPVRAVMQRLHLRNVDLPHFRLGPAASRAFAAGLQHNTTVQSLNLAGNSLAFKGSSAVAAALRVNRTLIQLDLSNANVGAAAHELFMALVDNGSLQQLSLKGNAISDVAGRSIGRALAVNSMLTNLDLSFNQLGDETAKGIANAMASCRLHTLNLKWNKIGAHGSLALGESLRRNTTLLLLDMSWNSLGETGGLAFAETLAFNDRLRVLDLSQNRLNKRCATLLAGSVSLNTSLSDLQLNHNPLSRAGAAMLIHTFNLNSFLKRWGLTGVGSALQARESGAKYDPRHPDGHHRLLLSDPWDHAVATLLHAYSVKQAATWHRAKLNGKVFPDSLARDGNYVLARAGKLELDFVLSHAHAPSKPLPVVHYVLDLAKSDEHRLARMLVVRAAEQPGENILKETIDGVPFQLREEDGLEWIEGVHAGTLEFDFLSTALAHEAHYKLDLAGASDNAIAYKLLERVFETGATALEGGMHGDCWTNATLNGRRFNLDDWRRGMQVGDTWVTSSQVTATGVKSAWRVPTQGILEFDFHSQAPQHVFTQHYRLNLAEENDRAIAHDLRVRASIVPGDNWWNEKIDGVPFRLADKFGKIGGDSLPRRGVLELDYVVTRPQETAKRMVKDHFELDLAVRQDRDAAVRLRKRARRAMAYAVREAKQLDADAVGEVDSKVDDIGGKRRQSASQRRRDAHGDSDSSSDDDVLHADARATSSRRGSAVSRRRSTSRRRSEQRKAGATRRMSRTRRDSQGQQSARASHSRRVSNSQGETTSTTPTIRNGPVVSDDEAESTPVKVKPTAIFASLGQSLGLAVQGEEPKQPQQHHPRRQSKPRRRSKSSVLASVAGEFAPQEPPSQPLSLVAQNSLFRVASSASLAQMPSSHGASTSLKRLPAQTKHAVSPGLKRVDTAVALQDNPESGHDEFVLNVSLSGAPLNVQAFLDSKFVLPAKGILALDFITFRGNELLSQRDHEALLVELRNQVSDIDRLDLLRMVLQGSADTALFFDCSMGKEVLGCFSNILEMEQALRLLIPRLSNPHRHGELLGVVKAAARNAELAAALAGTVPLHAKQQKAARRPHSSTTAD